MEHGMTKLIFVRHGEAEGNLKRVFQGCTDGELTKKGFMQVRSVAKRLRHEPIDIIYSSPLKRAYETAKAIADEKQILNIHLEEGLREIYGGEWENVPWDELPKRWPKEYNEWEQRPHLLCAPLGESMKNACERFSVSVEKIIAMNLGKNICIATHGTVLRTFICHLHNWSFEQLGNVKWQDNTAVTIVEFDKGEYNILLEGDNSHLGEELSTLATQCWWRKHNIIKE
jgi:probable phosphoglycerate mutase